MQRRRCAVYLRGPSAAPHPLGLGLVLGLGLGLGLGWPERDEVAARAAEAALDATARVALRPRAHRAGGAVALSQGHAAVAARDAWRSVWPIHTAWRPLTGYLTGAWPPAGMPPRGMPPTGDGNDAWQ